jgi:hypothetical protein
MTTYTSFDEMVGHDDTASLVESNGREMEIVPVGFYEIDQLGVLMGPCSNRHVWRLQFRDCVANGFKIGRLEAAGAEHVEGSGSIGLWAGGESLKPPSPDTYRGQVAKAAVEMSAINERRRKNIWWEFIFNGL